MIERTNYIEKLLGWKDEQVIKVVTGIRRCGKSTLLRQYQDALRQRGVSEEQIISVNFGKTSRCLITMRCMIT